MHGRGVNKSATSALLQKVNSQLRGEKQNANHNGDSDDGDDLDAYLSTLGKKKVSGSQPRWDKFGELSDSSLSDHDTKPRSGGLGSGSKFLKKKTLESFAAQTKPSGGHRTSDSSSKVKQSAARKVKGQVPSALDKTSSYQNQYGAANRNPAGAMLSDSDLDMDISMDQDIVADVKTWKKPDTSSNKVSSAKASYQTVDSDESSSIQIGRHGNKFLKKKPQPDSNQENISVNRRETHKHTHLTSNMALDSEEDSMVEMIESSRTPRGILKAPRGTGHTRGRPPSELEPQHSRQPVFRLELSHSDDESFSSVDSFKVNVMDLDDLEPVLELQPAVSKKANNVDSSQKKSKQYKHGKSSTKVSKASGKAKADTDEDDDPFKLMGLQTVDDLLGGDVLSVASIPTAGITSEIQTEAEEVYESDFEHPTRSGQTGVPLKSILATTPRNATPRSARSRVRYSLKEVTGSRSRSPSPEVISTARESKATSQIHTDYDDTTIGTEVSTARTIPEDDEDFSYSEDFSSSSPDRTPRSSYRRQDSDAYSDDFTSATETTRTTRGYSRSSSRESAASYSSDYTSVTESSRSRTPSPERRVPRSTKTSSVQTGTDMGLLYHWNTQTAGTAVLGPQYGMAFVDPTPIATHVVSPEALDAVTGYSPSVLALNDMLRQQLALTSQHLEMQRRLYQSYSSVALPDHQYTTLQETKQYIKKHKRPKLTFKEALKQVKREMGLK